MYGMVTKTRLRRSNPDERRIHILEVAREVFLEQGYGATSMSSISALLGGSKATLYKYFPSKEALFEEMVAHYCASFVAVLGEPDDDGADVEASLQSLGERYLRGLLKPEAIKLNRLVQAEGHRFPEVAATWYRTGPAASSALLVVKLDEFAAAGEIRGTDLQIAAEQYLAMLRGNLVPRAVCGLDPEPTSAQIKAQARAATKTIVSALRTQRTEKGPVATPTTA